MASTAGTPRARELGAKLRRHRNAAGLTTAQVGAGVGRGHSYVSRWENGKLVPSPEDTASVLTVCGVNGAERDRLLKLAREAADPDWLAPGVDQQLAALSEYERSARQIIAAEPMLIPGLCQTFDYATATVAAFGAARAEAEQQAMTRLGRQHILTDPTSKRFEAFIGEYALRYSTCPREAMSGQLHRLIELGQRANVTIRVVRLDTPLVEMTHGSWTLMSFEDTTPVVYLEHLGSTAAITDRRTVTRCEVAADSLREKAMSPAETAELIADLV